MANPALAVLENALRARKLDRTLTTTLPPLAHRADASTLAATDVALLDACLRGGLPRGQLSEIAGPQSSGRTLLLLQMMAAATRRGDIAALVDTLDRLDLASVVSAGVDLDRLLWIRGQAIVGPQASGPRAQGWVRSEALDSPGPRGLSPVASLDRTVDRALKALNLVLQAGGFGVVAIDLADVPSSALARIPLTTWLRVQRTIEGSETACVLMAPQPLARSARGVTLSLAGRARWTGDDRPQASGLEPQSGAQGPEAWSRSRRLAGVDVSVRVVAPRRHVDGEVCFTASTSHSQATEADSVAPWP